MEGCEDLTGYLTRSIQDVIRNIILYMMFPLR
jgi:hypothetical protein